MSLSRPGQPMIAEGKSSQRMNCPVCQTVNLDEIARLFENRNLRATLVENATSKRR
jgi:hypothetical protein